MFFSLHNQYNILFVSYGIRRLIEIKIMVAMERQNNEQKVQKNKLLVEISLYLGELC